MNDIKCNRNLNDKEKQLCHIAEKLPVNQANCLLNELYLHINAECTCNMLNTGCLVSDFIQGDASIIKLMDDISVMDKFNVLDFYQNYDELIKPYIPSSDEDADMAMHVHDIELHESSYLLSSINYIREVNRILEGLEYSIEKRYQILCDNYRNLTPYNIGMEIGVFH